MTLFDRRIERIARNRHGAFNIGSVRDAGGTDSMIRTRIADRAWAREARGVYRLTVFPRIWPQYLSIATLSKPGAAIGVRAAAAYLGLAGFAPCRPELVITPGLGHVSKLALVHEFAQTEVADFDGNPVTTVRQTLIDVAGLVSRDKLQRAVEVAVLENRLSIEGLAQRFLELEPSRPRGVADLRAVIDLLGDAGYEPPRSELERILYLLLDRYRIGYLRQASLDWRAPHPMIVDALVPSRSLIIEADGRRWHTRVADRERDHERDNVAAARGFRVMRFTHRMLTRRLDHVGSLLQDAMVQPPRSA